MKFPEKLFKNKKNFRVLLWSMILFFAVVLVRNAWVGDDAYISFRTIDNFINGYGLRWNAVERVQSFTHPLWVLVLSVFYFFTGEPYYTSLIFSILLTLVVVYLLGIRGSKDKRLGFLAILVLLLSKSFVDYSASGLENPLTHLLLVLFAFVYLDDKKEKQDRFWFLKISLIVSLLMLNRLDTGIFVMPALIYSFFKLKDKRPGFWHGVLGFLPLICWELFSLFYYGFPFPNTAYVKMFSLDIPMLDQAKQAGRYFMDSLSHDPITLSTVFVGSAYVFFKGRRHVKIALMLTGLVLYLAYIGKIGGDFMSGRFFAAPLLVTVVLFLHVAPKIKIGKFITVSLLILLFGLSNPISPLRTGVDFKDEEIARSGIADERAWYYGGTGLLHAFYESDWPGHEWMEEGRSLNESELKFKKAGNIGMLGFYAGPDVFILDDSYGLSDALMARMPTLSWGEKRIGHNQKIVPRGYVKTLIEGKNVIEHSGVSTYYDKLAFVTRGPLFSWERIKEIWNINVGKYQHYLDFGESLYGFGIRDLRHYKPTGTERSADGVYCWDDFAGDLFASSTRILTPATMSISLDNNDDYEIRYFKDMKEVDWQYVVAKGGTSGLTVHNLEVPYLAQQYGFDKIRVMNSDGDGKYCLGHLILDPVPVDEVETPL